MGLPGQSVCNTVGSAYVGSNPTPATTCEDGPLAERMRLCEPFLVCPAVCHLVALWTAVSRCPRTHDGRLSCRVSGRWNRRLFTDSHGRAALAACHGLTCAAESGVHPCVSARPVRLPGTRAAGKAGALMTGVAVRETVTLAGRAERARAARAFVGAVLGPGHPCGDDAELLVSDAAWQQCPAQRLRRSRRDGHGRGQDGRRGCPGRGHRPERPRSAGAGLSRSSQVKEH